MYKFFIILLSVILCFNLVLVIYGDEYDASLDETENETDEPNPIYSEIPSDVEPDLPFLPSGITDFEIMSVAPVTPSSTSGLKSALLAVLGDYDPVVVEYRYQNQSGSYSYLREVQPDYVWIWSCILLIIVIYCLFRLLGGVFGAKRY